mmetsp:Transcript_32998/g.50529  ORF Transcript_32998/g.50529 Transcript_32998/m.50529 type:complete len:115 (-) Transcript_32998:116-460(-)
MDDSHFLHYQVKYDVEYLAMPTVGDKIIANFVTVQKSHASFTLNDLITVIVPLEEGKLGDYEVKEIDLTGQAQEKPEDDDESELEMSEEDLGEEAGEEEAEKAARTKKDYQLWN